MMKMVSEILWNKIGKLTKMDGVLIVLLIIGLVVSVTSLFRGITMSDQVQVEFLEAANTTSSNRDLAGKLVIDVEGAVMTPGVFELSTGSRIKDALITAGGLSEKADRSFCEKNINLAQEIKDGQKIYIPFVSDTPSDRGYVEAKNNTKLVNLNTATMNELDTLWGVGPARAESIVKNRPYASVEEVFSKGGMTKQIFEKNREKLTVY